MISQNGNKITALINSPRPSANAVLNNFSPQCGQRSALGDISAPQVRQTTIFFRFGKCHSFITFPSFSTKKCAYRSRRTKNANSDSRQTSFIQYEIYTHPYKRNLLFFQKFKMDTQIKYIKNIPQNYINIKLIWQIYYTILLV